jgi:hypothetical protein
MARVHDTCMARNKSNYASSAEKYCKYRDPKRLRRYKLGGTGSERSPYSPVTWLPHVKSDPHHNIKRRRPPLSTRECNPQQLRRNEFKPSNNAARSSIPQLPKAQRTRTMPRHTTGTHTKYHQPGGQYTRIKCERTHPPTSWVSQPMRWPRPCGRNTAPTWASRSSSTDPLCSTPT